MRMTTTTMMIMKLHNGQRYTKGNIHFSQVKNAGINVGGLNWSRFWTPPTRLGLSTPRVRNLSFAQLRLRNDLKHIWKSAGNIQQIQNGFYKVCYYHWINTNILVFWMPFVCSNAGEDEKGEWSDSFLYEWGYTKMKMVRVGREFRNLRGITMGVFGRHTPFYYRSSGLSHARAATWNSYVISSAKHTSSPWPQFTGRLSFRWTLETERSVDSGHICCLRPT